jgi:Kdo2-lipid IVA lauroyltransferase/acyltransferase
MRKRLEFVLVWAAVKLLSLPPRSVARNIGAFIGRLALFLTPRLAGVGDLNLRLAFPGKSAAEREQILRKLYRNLGWLLAEFCQMPGYTPETTRSFIRYEGLEHYLAARDEGKGVLILTGHLGAWELSSFYHSLMGYPMSIVIRRLDNPLVDSLVNHIRCLHGNQVLHKDDFARGLLASMRRGETVGILMDTNMTPPQGSFVDFFAQSACTGTGLARIAMKTGARVLPGFLLWEEATQQYVLRFGAPLCVATGGDVEADAIANTAWFTKVIEDYVRQYPDQWLWVHRRWKTRPQGEEPIYT